MQDAAVGQDRGLGGGGRWSVTAADEGEFRERRVEDLAGPRLHRQEQAAAVLVPLQGWSLFGGPR